MSTPDRRAVLDRTHPELSVRRQCALLSLARSGVYRPVAATEDPEITRPGEFDGLVEADVGNHVSILSRCVGGK